MLLFFFFFFKQKTAYEMRISDWSSDVCSSDLAESRPARREPQGHDRAGRALFRRRDRAADRSGQARPHRCPRQQSPRPGQISRRHFRRRDSEGRNSDRRAARLRTRRRAEADLALLSEGLIAGTFGFTCGELETIVRMKVPVMFDDVSNS